ncbi:Putative AC transposase [Linum grandiflorum]
MEEHRNEQATQSSLPMQSQSSQSGIPPLPPTRGRPIRGRGKLIRGRPSTSIPPTRKPMKKRSIYWKFFVPFKDADGNAKAKCLLCQNSFAATSTNGTSGLKKHHDSCSRRNIKAMSELSLRFGIDNDQVSNWKFDQLDARKALVEMILLDELPFRFVEHEGFRRFMLRICPMFKIPGRKTVREDCFRMFVESKVVLIEFFRTECKGKVSLTTDAWTSLSNMNFMCVTAHFINKDWKLCKKIIAFMQITSHAGVDIGETLVLCLEEWGIKDILCIAMDNASANDQAIVHMKRKMKEWGSDFLDGKYLHIRCVAHIVNLVVNDGLKETGVSVERVREAVKWVKSSPARFEKFKKCISFKGIESKKLVSLDVATRWNSTYLMLEAEEKYEAAFKLLEGNEVVFKSHLDRLPSRDGFLGPPSSTDWDNVRMLMKYLRFFYDLTVRVSGTSYATTHMFCKELCDVFDEIHDLETSYTYQVREMAVRIKEKVAKYWFETDAQNPKLNRLLYIAVVLDPRRKFEYLEYILAKIYGPERGATLTNEAMDAIKEMFGYYKQLIATNAQSRVNSPNVREPGMVPISERKGGTDVEFMKKKIESLDRGNRRQVSRSELERYFSNDNGAEEELTVEDFNAYNYDVLGWWMRNEMRYPILSAMARDILAVPITTVASESTFSTGGRILDSFRTSLTPNIVEALICARDWIKSDDSKPVIDEEDLEEQVEFENVYASFQRMSVNGNEGASSASVLEGSLDEGSLGGNGENEDEDEDEEGEYVDHTLQIFQGDAVMENIP